MKHSTNVIRSNCHEVGTYNLKKITLSAFDDKRFLYTDGVRILAYGHVRIRSGRDNDGLGHTGSKK